MLLSELGEIEYVQKPLMIYRCSQPGAAAIKYEEGGRDFPHL